MDKRTSSTLEVLRQKLILPSDVVMIPVQDLDAKTREKIPNAQSSVALTHTNSRAASKVVDEQLSSLLELFREPSTISAAVAEFAHGSRQEAEAVLEDFVPIAIDLIGASILQTDTAQRTDDSRSQLAHGARFGKYTIVRSVQSVGKESVYLARDDHSEFYAIKIIQLDNDNTILSSSSLISHEIGVLKRLNDECPDACVKIVDSGTDDNSHWLVTKWVDGSAISQVAGDYRDGGDFDCLHTLVVGVAQRYAEIHAAGIGHGDVHPRNILVTANGQIKLIDFGYAQLLRDSSGSLRAGVAFYADPEFAKSVLAKAEPPPVSEQSEQFSVAALIFELLTGNHYDDFDLEERAMYSAIANPHPNSLNLPWGRTWSEMEGCLHKALSKYPSQRCPSTGIFAKELKDCDISNISLDRSTKSNSNRDESEINTFTRSSLDQLPDDIEQFINDLDSGPICSVSGGAAGVAYGLYRFACLGESAKYHELAQRWLYAAKRHEHDANAYHDPKYADEFTVVDACSIHHGHGGIPFVQALLSASISDDYLIEKSINTLLGVIRGSTSTWDTTLGRLSGVLAMCEICATIDKEIDKSSIVATQMTTIVDSIWDQLENTDVTSCEGNLGFSHGTAGLLYTTALVNKLLGRDQLIAERKTLDRFCEQIQPIGRGRGFPWRVNRESDPNVMGGWCNGSSGAIQLFSLLYECNPDSSYLEKIEQFGWHVWESDSGAFDLCCGSAGSVYALIRIFQMTHNDLWIDRARVIAKKAVFRESHLQDEDHPPWSLFKGRLGLALAVKSLKYPDEATMPMMGLAA